MATFWFVIVACTALALSRGLVFKGGLCLVCYKLLNGDRDLLQPWIWGRENGSQSQGTCLRHVGLGGASRQDDRVGPSHTCLAFKRKEVCLV